MAVLGLGLLGFTWPMSVGLAIAALRGPGRRHWLPWIALALAVLTIWFYVLLVGFVAEPSTTGGGYANNAPFAFWFYGASGAAGLVVGIVSWVAAGHADSN